jgi:hypothetical protein
VRRDRKSKSAADASIVNPKSAAIEATQLGFLGASPTPSAALLDRKSKSAAIDAPRARHLSRRALD